MSTNEVDDFLGDITRDSEEKIDLFGEEETPIPQEEVEEVKEEEKPLPFHKDPKVLRFIEKEIAKRAPKQEEVFKKEVQNDDDDYYVRLIGNDTPEKLAMIREAKQRDERLLQQAEERAFNKLSFEKQRELEAERRAEEQLTTAIEDIEETFNVDLTSKDPVARKTRVDFMTFVEKIAPKNAQGEIVEYPDMTSAFETFKEMRKTAPSSARAKDLSSRSMARSSNTIEKPQERITFDNIDDVFAKLLNK